MKNSERVEKTERTKMITIKLRYNNPVRYLARKLHAWTRLLVEPVVLSWYINSRNRWMKDVLVHNRLMMCIRLFSVCWWSVHGLLTDSYARFSGGFQLYCDTLKRGWKNQVYRGGGVIGCLVGVMMLMIYHTWIVFLMRAYQPWIHVQSWR